MTDIAIRVENLSKAYKLYQKPVDRLKEALHPLKKKYHKDFYALKNLSFEIKKGETVGIVGKNGSGKSTLLKLITGVTTPTGGKITINGRISAILELGAGFNPQMSGLENIYLNSSINGMSKKATDSKVAEIIEFAELGQFIHQPVKTYSSGMRARLAFAVSISVEPDILIVDEALSVGDAAFARKCFAKMEDIRAKGATILFVSHSENSVVTLCNRAIWISNGQQIIDGTPKLVTGLYAKHMNKNRVNKKDISNEYNQLVGIQSFTDEISNGKEFSAVNNNLNKNSQDFFDPALQTKTAIQTESKDIKINNVVVLNKNGIKVNSLIPGSRYYVKLSVEFYSDIKNINIALGIRTKSGILISGIATNKSHGHVYQHIEAGTKKEINIGFDCNLLPDIYFVSCNINGVNLDSTETMFRIRDALCFKVQPTSNLTCVGLVDLDMRIS